jgi:hypothetical protein
MVDSNEKKWKSNEKVEKEDTKKEIIRKVAYKIWEIRGKEDGHALQDWIDAEEIVNLILSFRKSKRKRVFNKEKINFNDGEKFIDENGEKPFFKKRRKNC